MYFSYFLIRVYAMMYIKFNLFIVQIELSLHSKHLAKITLCLFLNMGLVFTQAAVLLLKWADPLLITSLFPHFVNMHFLQASEQTIC